MFKERCLKMLEDECTDMDAVANMERTKHQYAIICSSFLREYCMEKHPESTQRRQELKDKLEKLSEEDF